MNLPKVAIEWNSLNSAKWEARLAEAEGPTAYQQHWAYGAMAHEVGARADRIVFHADGRCLGLVQIQYRRWFKFLSLALAMRGPIWLPSTTEAEKSAVYRQLRRSVRGGPLKFGLWMPEGDDAASLRQNRMRCVVSPYHTALIDLSEDEPRLLENMDGKWRNRLRAADRKGIRAEAVGTKPQQYAWLLEAEAKQQKSKRYSALSPALVPIFQQHAGRTSVVALKATIKGEPIAGMLCLRHGNSATYHIGWSNEDGKKANAHNVLMWQMVRKLKAAGVRWFDLGGIATDTGAGLARFKLGTGARPHSLAGTYF